MKRVVLFIAVMLAGCATTGAPRSDCPSIMDACNPADYPSLRDTLPPWPFPRLLKIGRAHV